MRQGFSIVVPTHNRSDRLELTLLSLTALKKPADQCCEVIVVDNASRDRTKDVVDTIYREMPGMFRMICENRLGLGFARNTGLREARYDYVVFFDDDVEVAHEWLEAALEAFEICGADCVVGPVDPWFETEPPACLTPRVLDSLTSSYSRRGDAVQRLQGAEACQIPGCNFAVKRAAAMEVKGFDERLDRRGREVMGGGDWDFGERLVRAGKAVFYHPKCRIRHWISRQKLSKAHLRRRWYGFGQLKRIRDRERGLDGGWRGKVHVTRLLIWHVLISLKWSLCGERARAFEEELFALRDLGRLGLPFH